LRCGWDVKYVYSFTWMGQPIIQLPEDIVRLQELFDEVRPDVVLETGVAHGGSLLLWASLCRAAQRGRVIGVDIEIRPHNRAALESHGLAPLITLVEGSSTDPEAVDVVRRGISPGETVMVILDSNHTREHVLAELEAYSGLVSVGSYIVAMDGIMALVADTPRGRPEWSGDNPISAVEEFVREHPEFVVQQPEWPFNESDLRTNITHWQEGYLRRVF